jgi:hypothetical protein
VDDIPADVLGLLRDCVYGLDDLELLLLVRGDAVKGWSAPTVAARLGVPEARIEGSLEALCAAALVVTDETEGDGKDGKGGKDGKEATRRFFYRPATPALEATVNALAWICEARPADVIRALNDHALDRVRSAARRAFLEVFAFEKQAC